MTAALLSQPPTGPPLAAVAAIPDGSATSPAVAGGFPGLLAALLSEVAVPGAPAAPSQTKPVLARPAPKRQPGDDPAVTSLAAALLPPLPPALASVGPIADDVADTGAAVTGGQPSLPPPGAADLLDSSLTSPAPGALEPVGSAPEEAVAENAVPETAVSENALSAAPENTAPENAPPAPAGQDLPVGDRGPALAFAVRLTASAPPAPSRPAAAASGPAIAQARESVADRAASPAVQNPPAAEPASQTPDPARTRPSRQPASDGIQAQDLDSPPSAPAERSGAGAIETERPASPRGTSNEPRGPENPRPPASSVGSQDSGITCAAAVTAPAASSTPASGARDRNPEAAVPPPEAPREQPRESAVRELSLALPGPSNNGHQAEQVSLRVVERAGEVQVAVRTSDPQLADALRQNLGDLVSDLAGRGYRAETWQPLAGSGTEASVLPRAGSTGPDSGPGQGFPGQAGDGSRNGGSTAGQQQQQRRGRDPEQPSWLQALTSSAARTGSTPYDHYTH